MVRNLSMILKDADALDRSRLTLNTPVWTFTDLEPRYLRFSESRKLLDVSYGLEALTQKVQTKDIINYKNEDEDKHYYEEKSLRDELEVSQVVKDAVVEVGKNHELNRNNEEL